MPSAYQKVLRDITEDRIAEEKQAVLAAIVNSSDDAIISKTLKGIITSWNNAATRMFGYPETEAIGRHITLIIPSNRIQEETMIIEKIRKGEKIDHFETVRVAKDGKEINLSLTVSPVKNKKGEIIGASKIARDITAKKELERQSQLYTEKLQELNKYKDEFMAMASHELKTPLTVIKANIQVLQQKITSDPNGIFIDKTLSQVNKLSDLISSLLDVSKIQSGKLEINLSIFDIATLVKEVVANLQQTTLTHTIIFNSPGKEILANADRERIEQVLVNLIMNAIKYSPKAKDVTVDCYEKDGKINVSIKDNGIGIPSEDIQNIFTSFYRVRGLASSFAGSGIGLYISSEIIKRHGGEIWAESKVDEGSVFYFSIPIAK